MHKASLPALIIVGAGVYVLYKKSPNSQLSLAIKKLAVKAKSAAAQPQAGPPDLAYDVLDVHNWSDKSTSLYVQQTQSPAPAPPVISAPDTARDYRLTDLLSIPSAVPILTGKGGNVS